MRASWLKLTSAPRTRGGATSLMYSGTAIDAEPTASPITNLMAISIPEFRREGGSEHSGNEDRSREEDHRPSTDAIGQPARAESAHRRAREQRPCHQLLVEGAHVPEAGVQEEQGPRYDAGVVAEQQPAERRDSGGPDNSPTDGLSAGDVRLRSPWVL